PPTVWPSWKPIKMKFLTVPARVALCLVCLSFQQVKAENCWMIGCVGRIGYVYLPTSGYPPSHYTFNGRDCGRPQHDGWPFQSDTLPDVNSIVTISNDGAGLLTEDMIQTHLGSFQGVSIVDNNAGDGCQAVIPRPTDVSVDPMHPGAKVKILGYRTFVSQVSEQRMLSGTTSHNQILFALVLVESDL